jgi:hypothetical protein
MLGGRAAWEAMQPRRRKCERCGLYYRESLEKCRWCGDLDERGLEGLREKIEHQHQSNGSLGQILFVIAAIAAVLVLLI